MRRPREKQAHKLNVGYGEKFRELETSTELRFKYNVTVTAILDLGFFLSTLKERESQKVIHSQVGSGFCEVDRTIEDSRGLRKYGSRLKDEDEVALSRVLAPSGHRGELTQPSLHLLVKYCMLDMRRNTISLNIMAEGEDIRCPIDWPYKLWSPVTSDV